MIKFDPPRAGGTPGNTDVPFDKGGSNLIIRRHNRICRNGACAAIVADTGKAENHRSIEIQKKEIEPRIFELAIGTLKFESRVCDLPRRVPKRVV